MKTSSLMLAALAGAGSIRSRSALRRLYSLAACVVLVASLLPVRGATAPAAPKAPSAPPPAPYAFRVGETQCTVLFDRLAQYPLDSLYAGVPMDTLTAELRRMGAPTDRIVTPYEGLLVRTPSNVILIDTGAGPSTDPAKGRLLASLAQVGVRPEQIDTVILTHAHGDHIGGTITADGTPAFPRAKYVISRAEWEFWTQPAPDLSRLNVDAKSWTDFGHAHLLPLRGQIELVDHDGEIRPGISVVLTGGHTPGHMVVQVASGGEKLLVIGDLVLTPALLEHPDWHSKYDWDRPVLRTEAVALLAPAARDHVLIHAMHFPYPSVGHITAVADHFVWSPATP